MFHGSTEAPSWRTGVRTERKVDGDQVISLGERDCAFPEQTLDRFQLSVELLFVHWSPAGLVVPLLLFQS